MAFFRNFKKSFEELKSIRCLTVTALLIGVSVALKFVMIMPSETLKISFAFVGLAAIGMLYGPVVAGLAGVVTDVIGFLVKPTGAFSPIFTLVEVAGAVIYGIFLYGLNPVKLDFSSRSAFFGGLKTNGFQVFRIFMAKFCVNLFCNVFLNTLCLTVLYGQAFMVILPARALKNLIMWPISKKSHDAAYRGIHTSAGALSCYGGIPCGIQRKTLGLIQEKRT
mgnify:CR=1 FL=1